MNGNGVQLATRDDRLHLAFAIIAGVPMARYICITGHLMNYVHTPLRWRHNGCDSVSNHQPHDCSLKRLFRPTSKKTSKLPVTDLCVGNSPETGEFPAQRGSNAEDVSIWWRHHLMNYGHTLFIVGVWWYRLNLIRILQDRFPVAPFTNMV